MTLPAARELASIVVRLAEARACLDRCRNRRDSARAARRLASLLRDIDTFFALHGDTVPDTLEAAVRADMGRLGNAVLLLSPPAGRA